MTSSLLSSSLEFSEDSRKKLPRHVAIIPDGNRRFAKKNAKKSSFGHKQGAHTLIEIVEEASELGIEYLTFYLFSTENWHRPQWEIAALMWLLNDFLKEKTPTLIENGISLETIGDIEKLPYYVRKRIKESKKATENGTRLKLIFALNYGGRDELCRAFRKMGKELLSGSLKIEDIVEENMGSYLDTGNWPEPDLLIRTSGELRFSNFLLWQSSYSELYFSNALWPDFTRAHFREALACYLSRKRRIGS